MVAEAQDYPTVVYKYRDWENPSHKTILTENTLFMASPNAFNDPFDCRIPMNLSLLDTPEKKKSYIDFLLINHFNWLTKNGVDLEREMTRMDYDFTHRLDKLQEDNEKVLFDFLDKYIGVLPLSGRWDSVLMWSHYANNHKGFCVGFKEEPLRNSTLFSGGGPVYYDPNDKFPEISPKYSGDETLKRMYTQTHTKAHDWTYEQEYRLIKFYHPNVPDDIGRRSIYPDSCLAEIIIGLHMVDENRDQLIEIGKKRNVPVYQIRKIPFHFKVEKVEVVN